MVLDAGRLMLAFGILLGYSANTFIVTLLPIPFLPLYRGEGSKDLQWPRLHRRRTVHGMCRDPPRGSLVIGNNEAFYTADIRDTNENEE